MLVTPNTTGTNQNGQATKLTADLNNDAFRTAILRAELKALQEDQAAGRVFRDYYDGTQPLAYSTALFTETFGESFKGFKDNWMGVIVGAPLSRLQLQNLTMPATRLADKTTVDYQKSLDRIWGVFLDNEIEETEVELHEGVLVESSGAMIVWPDKEMGATIDWQPQGLVRVKYADDSRRQILWAVKRWQADSQAIYVNVYTPTHVHKFVERQAGWEDSPSSSYAFDEIPDVGGVGFLQRREIPGEPNPLPHSFGRVPVVEFNNTRRRSQLADAISQQDALNKTLLDMMVAGAYRAVPQMYVESASNEPVGGWVSGPGEVWHFKPAFDADGKPITATFGTFPAADPTAFIKPIEMWLAHMAHTHNLPERLFLSQNSGGRGDAPSGTSMQVDDKPLNDMVSKKQRFLSNSWMEVAGLVATALEIKEFPYRRGQVQWRDPRYDYRLAILQEAAAMMQIGLPFKYIIRQLGMSDAEVVELEAMKEAEVEEQAEMAEEKMELEATVAAANKPEPATATSGAKSDKVAGSKPTGGSPASDPSNR